MFVCFVSLNFSLSLSLFPPPPPLLSSRSIVKPANGIVMTEELREELDQAALATQHAFLAARGGAPTGKREEFEVLLFVCLTTVQYIE